MLLGADPIASTPIAGLLAAGSSAAVVSLANDPRYSARRNIHVKWGNDPEPELERELEVEAPAIKAVEAPEILADGIAPVSLGIDDRPSPAPPAPAAPEPTPPAPAVDLDAERRARKAAELEAEIAEIERVGQEFEAANRAARARAAQEEAARLAPIIARQQQIAAHQADPLKAFESVQTEMATMIRELSAARAQLAGEIASMQTLLTEVRRQAEVAAEEIRRSKNATIAAQTAALMLFSDDSRGQ